MSRDGRRELQVVGARKILWEPRAGGLAGLGLPGKVSIDEEFEPGLEGGRTCPLQLGALLRQCSLS